MWEKTKIYALLIISVYHIALNIKSILGFLLGKLKYSEKAITLNKESLKNDSSLEKEFEFLNMRKLSIFIIFFVVSLFSIIELFYLTVSLEYKLISVLAALIFIGIKSILIYQIFLITYNKIDTPEKVPTGYDLFCNIKAAYSIAISSSILYSLFYKNMISLTFILNK